MAAYSEIEQFAAAWTISVVFAGLINVTFANQTKDDK